MPNLDKENSKQISIWGEKLTGELTICEYYEVENKSRCGRLASWKHRENRNYCKIHHELVNKINCERQQEFIAEFKENINKYITEELETVNIFLTENKNNENGNGWKECLIEIQSKLNNGDFD